MKRHCFPRASGPCWLLLAALGLACGRESAREPPPPRAPAAAPGGPALDLKTKPEGAPEAEQAAPAEPAAAPPVSPPPPASARPPATPTLPNAGRARPARKKDRVESDRDDERANPALLHQRLQEALRQATPDCPTARSRTQAICDLANQICQMVDRDPEIASVDAYCADARQRCSEAEQRTAQRCK